MAIFRSMEPKKSLLSSGYFKAAIFAIACIVLLIIVFGSRVSVSFTAPADDNQSAEVIELSVSDYRHYVNTIHENDHPYLLTVLASAKYKINLSLPAIQAGKIAIDKSHMILYRLAKYVCLALAILFGFKSFMSWKGRAKKYR